MRTRPSKLALPVLAFAAIAAVPAPAGAAPTASVRVVDCQTGKDAGDRVATYHARMRAVPGTARMAVRFSLVARYGDRGPRVVKTPKLSAWHYSRPGVQRFGYTQKVRRLESGGLYRARVRYRWYAADGHVVRAARSESGFCAENGELANLTVTAIRFAPGSIPGTASYVVSIGNSGRGDATRFSLALIVDNALADERTIDRLGAGETTSVTLTGPVCHRVRAVIDRGDLVPETIEQDNVLRSRC